VPPPPPVDGVLGAGVGLGVSTLTPEGASTFVTGTSILVPDTFT